MPTYRVQIKGLKKALKRAKGLHGELILFLVLGPIECAFLFIL